MKNYCTIIFQQPDIYQLMVGADKYEQILELASWYCQFPDGTVVLISKKFILVIETNGVHGVKLNQTPGHLNHHLKNIMVQCTNVDD